MRHSTTNRLAHGKVVTEQKPESIPAQPTRSVLWLFVLSCFCFGVLLRSGMGRPVSLHSAETHCNLIPGTYGSRKGLGLICQPIKTESCKGCWTLESPFFLTLPQNELVSHTTTWQYKGLQKVDSSNAEQGINMILFMSILLFCLGLASNLLCPSLACFSARIIHECL